VFSVFILRYFPFHH
ncbi:putative membrane protein, partial [Chlamydia psittaci 02DC14]